MTLEKQYKRYLRENPINPMEYREWLEYLSNQIAEAIEVADKRDEGELPGKLSDVVAQISLSLSERLLDIKYYGDVSDLGNEIGYTVGNVLKNMTEQETTDFVHGITHGISLTNGTH